MSKILEHNTALGSAGPSPPLAPLAPPAPDPSLSLPPSQSNRRPSTSTSSSPPQPLPHPVAIVLAYAALDFNFTSWMTRDNLDVLRSEHRAQSTLAAAAQSQLHLAPPPPAPSRPQAADGDKEPRRRTSSRLRNNSSATNLRALKRMAEGKDHLGHTSPLVMFKDVKSSTSSGPLAAAGLSALTPAHPAKDQSEKQQHEETVMGVRRKKSWSRSLSGTLKSLASPLSPVAKEKDGRHRRNLSASVSPATNGGESSVRARASTMSGSGSSGSESLGTPLAAATTGTSSRPSKATSFKTRLRDRVVSELGDLEVNTSDLSLPSSTRPAHPLAGPPTSAEALGTNTYPTPGGLDADDEGDFSLTTDRDEFPESEDEDELAGVPEAEREYYPLADKDKPLSARVLYPSDDEFAPSEIPPSASGISDAQVRVSIPVAQASPVPMSAVNPTPVSRSQVGTMAIERSDSRDKGKGVERQESVATAAVRRKVPIGTRLTMTSRAGFFQDRIVSPSMVSLSSLCTTGIVLTCLTDARHGHSVHRSSTKPRFCSKLLHISHPYAPALACSIPSSAHALWREGSVCR